MGYPGSYTGIKTWEHAASRISEELDNESHTGSSKDEQCSPCRNDVEQEIPEIEKKAFTGNLDETLIKREAGYYANDKVIENVHPQKVKFAGSTMSAFYDSDEKLAPRSIEHQSECNKNKVLEEHKLPFGPFALCLIFPHAACDCKHVDRREDTCAQYCRPMGNKEIQPEDYRQNSNVFPICSEKSPELLEIILLKRIVSSGPQLKSRPIGLYVCKGLAPREKLHSNLEKKRLVQEKVFPNIVFLHTILGAAFVAYPTVFTAMISVLSTVSVMVVSDGHGPAMVDQEKDQSRESFFKETAVREIDWELDGVASDCKEGGMDTLEDNSNQNPTKENAGINEFGVPQEHDDVPSLMAQNRKLLFLTNKIIFTPRKTEETDIGDDESTQNLTGENPGICEIKVSNEHDDVPFLMRQWREFFFTFEFFFGTNNENFTSREAGVTNTVDTDFINPVLTEYRFLGIRRLFHNYHETVFETGLMKELSLSKDGEISTLELDPEGQGLEILPRNIIKKLMFLFNAETAKLQETGDTICVSFVILKEGSFEELWLNNGKSFEDCSSKYTSEKLQHQTFCDISIVILYRHQKTSNAVTRKENARKRTFEEETDIKKHFEENQGTMTHTFEELYEPAFWVNNFAKISDVASDPPGQQSVYIPPGDVRKEAYRLSTFDNFPRNVTVSIVQLAKKGFHYTGYLDRVKCYSCGRTIEKFEPSDSADDNRYHKQDCLIMQGRATDNVPIGGFMSRRVNSGTDAAMFSRMTQNASTSSSNIGDRLSAGGTAQVRPGGSVNISANGGVSTLNGPLRNAAASTGTPRQWRLANIISSDHRRYLTNLHLNREIDRLATFSRWPITRPNVAPVDVARAGFFYLGDMDRTQCFSCGGVLRNWTREDNAMEEHRTHFATCRFVLGTDNRNVPVPILPETQAQMTANYPCQHPTNPHMRSEQTRFATFDSRWPSVRTRATPEQIAEAGFFYLGERDRVKCWYCNGGLQNWEYDDIPWVEHAKWFPSCQFLLNRKGQHFVYRHLSVSPHLPRPVIGRQAGATIDPVEAGQQRGQDIPPQISRARAPTPPPRIIDPQEQMRLRKQEVDKEIRENFGVRLVIDMGFAEEVVRKVLEERLEYLMSAEDQMDHIRTRIFDNTEQLLNAVQEREAEIKRELAEEREATRLKEIQQSSTRLRDVPEPMSVSSTYSSYEGPPTETTSSMATHASGVNNVSGFNMDSDEEGDIYGSVPQGAAAAPATIPTSLSEIPNFGMDIPEDAALIQDMIERKKEEGLCKICFTEPADMVFMPCSHMCCCKNCTEAIRYCPVCRKKISQAIKTYLK